MKRVSAVIVLAIGLASCTSEPAPKPSASPSPSVSSTASPTPGIQPGDLHWVRVSLGPDCPNGSRFDVTPAHYTICIPSGWGFWDTWEPMGTGPMALVPSFMLGGGGARLFSSQAWPWPVGDSVFEVIRDRGIMDFQFGVDSAQDPMRFSGCRSFREIRLQSGPARTCSVRWSIGGPGKASDQITYSSSGDYSEEIYVLPLLEPPEFTPDSNGRPGARPSIVEPRLIVIATYWSERAGTDAPHVRRLVDSIRPYRGSHRDVRIPLCRAQDLRVEPRWGAAAGHYGGTWRFVNQTGAPCVLFGEPAAVVVDTGGKILSRYRPSTGSPSRWVLVEPASEAEATVLWGNWCGTAHPPVRLRIVLAHERGTLDVPVPGMASCTSAEAPPTLVIEPFSPGWVRYRDTVLGISFMYPPVPGIVTRREQSTATGPRVRWTVLRTDRCTDGSCRSYEIVALNDGCPGSEGWPTFAHAWERRDGSYYLTSCGGTDPFRITPERVVTRPDGREGLVYRADVWFERKSQPDVKAGILNLGSSIAGHYDAISFYIEDPTTADVMEQVIRSVRLPD